jgi:hypothetical protein
MSYKEPKNRKISDSEVSTVILIAAMYFGGNIETALSFVRSTNLMPQMLSKNRFNRRMHKIGELLADEGIRLLAARKNNSKRSFNPCREYLITCQRKQIEMQAQFPII